MSALKPLAPIQSVNFPSDREYTLNSLVEELTLMERHLRDGSWKLCSCNPEKHLPLVAGLASEGYGFTDDPEEKEFMRQLRDRARVWRDKIKSGVFNASDADDMRAWTRDLRHRIEFQTWSGPMEEAPELVDIVQEIHGLSGDIQSFEEQQVDEILTHLSEKHEIPKPSFRFIDECNPMKDAYMIGSDITIKEENGEITRIPLTDLDELVFCRGGASPYAIAHEFCHFKDRVKTGVTNEKTATDCALIEVGNNIKKNQDKKNLYNLGLKESSGGIMGTIEKLTSKIGDSLPLIGGVIAGELIDASGTIDNAIVGFTGAWTGLAKGLIGAAIVGAGLGMKKGAMADVVIGAGLPIAASGITQQFLGGVVTPTARATTVMPITSVPQLTSYGRPTGLRAGHPTLGVPYIPPRPGILSPSQINPSLAGKYILGTG